MGPFRSPPPWPPTQGRGSKKLTRTTSLFIRWSILVLFRWILPQFFMIFVSKPARFPSTHPSVYLPPIHHPSSIYSSIHPSLHSSIHQSIHCPPTIHPPSIHSSIHPLTICPSIHPFIHPLSHLLIHPPTLHLHLSTYSVTHHPIYYKYPHFSSQNKGAGSTRPFLQFQK